MVLKRADERRTQARDGFMIERVLAGLAANTIRSEESGHGLLDGYLDNGGLGGAHTEALRGVELDPKIVLSGSEPGKIDERIDRGGAHRIQRFTLSTHGHANQQRLETRRQPGPEIPATNRHTGHLTLERCRHDLHPDLGALIGY